MAAVCLFPMLRIPVLKGAAAENGKQLAELRITTANGLSPTFDIIRAPEDFWGVSVTNNNFEDCTVEYINPNDGSTVTDEAAKIKIRGNSSAVTAFKRPYKLKLSKKQAFGTDSRAKKWVLLRGGTDLKFLFSNWTAVYCGMAWEPVFEPVNVTLNGKYRGCYILAQAVENITKKLDFDETGFLAENDAYFWKENTSFHLEQQDSHFAFTFKEPEADALTAEQQAAIIQKITAAADSIVQADESAYLSHIDAENFAAWFLARDFLCTADSGGTNMFWYAETADAKLKLGPMWDYDANFLGTSGKCFTSYDENTMFWSAYHTLWTNFADSLFEKASFRRIYRNQLEKKRNICADLTAYVNDYISQYGDALQKAWDQDAFQWGETAENVHEIKDKLLQFYQRRFDYITERTAGWSLDYTEYYKVMAAAQRISEAEYANYSVLREAMQPDVYALSFTQEALDSTTDNIRSAIYALIPKTEPMRGDLNGDGIISLKDAVLLRRLIAGGWNVSADEAVSDVNGDGAVNLKDVVMLRRYAAGGWGVVL